MPDDKIMIFDTTLRDGEQSAGTGMTGVGTIGAEAAVGSPGATGAPVICASALDAMFRKARWLSAMSSWYRR